MNAGLGNLGNCCRVAVLPRQHSEGQRLTEARPEGLEPPAFWSEARRSIQLSYGRMMADEDATFEMWIAQGP